MASKNKDQMSYQTKTIIVILLLLFMGPIGLIFMFLWMRWPVWVKIVVTIGVLIVTLPFIAIFLISFLIAVNPSEAKDRAQDTVRMTDIIEIQQAVQDYKIESEGTLPRTLDELVPVYFSTVPTDPETEVPYFYEVTHSGQDFAVCATIEAEFNADIPGCLNLTGSFSMDAALDN